eukprot:gnl/MRDRNA2_/MRDRNA2_50324_c0_seq1.p1 gnl/MRDRNA2_/MRDRNA2_50324_c0~~gnl/MRDRNA2_/MRDRNA2_50324_c0_seq1.p1  ORF type:complete len:194 (+),score=29.50 gnl/MRDRNA2_/MRDRNA2_50324_c0_seq1:69-584(+)
MQQISHRRMDAFADQLQRLSEPMTKAYGWKVVCCAAAAGALMFFVPLAMLLDKVAGGAAGIVGFIFVMFGPILAGAWGYHKSKSTIDEAVDLMEGVMSDLNQEIQAKGLQWEHRETVVKTVQTHYGGTSQGAQLTSEKSYHCWSLRPLAPGVGPHVVGLSDVSIDVSTDGV